MEELSPTTSYWTLISFFGGAIRFVIHKVLKILLNALVLNHQALAALSIISHLTGIVILILDPLIDGKSENNNYNIETKLDKVRTPRIKCLS